jgi:hypothetical protein
MIVRSQRVLLQAPFNWWPNYVRDFFCFLDFRSLQDALITEVCSLFLKFIIWCQQSKGRTLFYATLPLFSTCVVLLSLFKLLQITRKGRAFRQRPSAGSLPRVILCQCMFCSFFSLWLLLTLIPAGGLLWKSFQHGFPFKAKIIFCSAVATLRLSKIILYLVSLISTDIILPNLFSLF